MYIFHEMYTKLDRVSHAKTLLDTTFWSNMYIQLNLEKSISHSIQPEIYNFFLLANGKPGQGVMIQQMIVNSKNMAKRNPKRNRVKKS